MQKAKQLIDYAATYPDAIITYRASNTFVNLHSDESYLSESRSRRRAGGHFFMTDESENMPNNGDIMTISQIFKAVMSSAAEAELCALYVNCREAIPSRIFLEEMGH